MAEAPSQQLVLNADYVQYQGANYKNLDTASYAQHTGSYGQPESSEVVIADTDWIFHSGYNMHYRYVNGAVYPRFRTGLVHTAFARELIYEAVSRMTVYTK